MKRIVFEKINNAHINRAIDNEMIMINFPECVSVFATRVKLDECHIVEMYNGECLLAMAPVTAIKSIRLIRVGVK